EMQAVLRSLLGPDIDLELNLTAGDPAIRLDRSEIEQILLTSVRNSRDAMPHGGTYVIETANVAVQRSEGHRGSKNYVRWSMADTGIGMTESTRQRAFEPFFTTKPSGAGTGLGLAMVKAAIERCEGSTTLDSDLGRG